MSIKRLFENISFFQKFELYVIVIAITILVNFLYDNIVLENRSKRIIVKKTDSNLTKELTPKITRLPKTSIIKEIDKIATQYHLMITNSNYSNDNITLNLEGKFYNIINYLNYLNVHFNIDSFSIKSDHHIVIATIKFKINYYFNSLLKLQDIKPIPNPFIYNKQNNIKQEKSLPKLNAILGTTVSLNHKWYNVGDKILHYKIIKIDYNSIVLKDQLSKKQYILKVYSDE